MATSDHRIAIILPPAEAALADAIAERIGAGVRGKSAAIRYALRQTAVSMGIRVPEEKKIKKAT